MKKILISLLLIASLILAMSSCGKQEPEEVYDGSTTWSIYWYLCGSDLESWYGCATEDIEEMMAVKLPENVKVIIQTGGALSWEKDNIPEDKIGRFIYDSKGLKKLEEQPQANMGEAQTLEDFLRFCTEKYPADRQMVSESNE